MSNTIVWCKGCRKLEHTARHINPMAATVYVASDGSKYPAIYLHAPLTPSKDATDPDMRVVWVRPPTEVK